MKKQNLRTETLIFGLILLAAVGVNAQFSSGSTGANGALDTSTMNCPTGICYVQLPESGVLNYSTIKVAVNHLVFLRNSRNTPVILLAQGNVDIIGGADLNVGQPGEYDGVSGGNVPGPGGFYGGAPNTPGFGPGAGTLLNPGGRWVGPLSLNPIIGGSGGAGVGGLGCGGGGALLIASSGTITISFPSRIRANSGFACSYNAGSGGAIRLAANTLNIAGTLSAQGFSNGVIRLEALQGQLNFTGIAVPNATLVPFTGGTPPIIVTTAPPVLSIISVGGYAVPTYSGTRFDTIDLLLPNQIPDPVNVIVNANNIPTGTQVQVGFVSGSPSGTSSPCNLSGSLASSTCTATISNLARTGVTYLLATAAFTPPGSLAQYNPKGPYQVVKVRLEAVVGEKPKYVFLGANEKAIETINLRPEFLQFFGI